MPEDKPIQYLKGVGEARAKTFAKLGLFTCADLLRHFPRDYEDRTVIYHTQNAPMGTPVCLRATVAEPILHTRAARGLELCKTRIADDYGTVFVTWFSAPYVKNALIPGQTYIFYGRLVPNGARLEMQNPLFESAEHPRDAGHFVPVYRLTTGLSGGQLRAAMRQALSLFSSQMSDPLPHGLRQKYQLCHTDYAYRQIHFPDSLETMTIARRRFVFEELLTLALGLSLHRAGHNRTNIPPLPAADLTGFWDKLPFAPTGAQWRVAEQIAADLSGQYPMHRLLQGDVGSGKTAVAAAAVYLAARGGVQSAMMAPTTILAEQHYHSLLPLMERLGIETGLLTGSTPAAHKKTTLKRLANGDLGFVVGTHALLSEKVVFQDLRLTIADEQHRFGVAQRATLNAKGQEPHTLLMSATPIPRTLARVLYGDLDVSLLDEMPPGRQKVDTFVVDEGYRQRIENFIRKEVAAGRQVYIVCPLVEVSEEAQDERRAATEYTEHLKSKVFPDLKIGMLHGKLKPADKDAVMRDFAGGHLDILVSTTVIEVGVDVPNATLMVVENAERFGLSTLHQLRGRVGRGGYKSHCILFMQTGGEIARQRLEVLRSTSDGFAIAEQDLRLRGPGDFFGARQHGLPTLKVADLSYDMEILEAAQAAAGEILASDPELRDAAHLPLRTMVDTLMAQDG